ncbi:MAG: 1,4-dihydroxy-6-naphthoate synthase [Bacteroidota bacterium]
MKLSLGFSPCPNDTFIFDGLVHHKIDTEGLEFDVLLADVEELNRKAFKRELNITKLSYHTFGYLLDDYALLDAGSALGNNCGPLLIAKKPFDYAAINDLNIAIPGKYTTANFLLSIAFPEATNKEEYLFSEIENAVLEGKVDAGLIIHENRFTYAQKGLKKLIDLGEYWETKTNLPIPLGCIAVSKKLPKPIQQTVNRVLRRSVEFALNNPLATMDYVRPHAQEMDDEVMMQHIGLYVNDYTVDLGPVGRKAIERLFKIANEKGIIKFSDNALFI